MNTWRLSDNDIAAILESEDDTLVEAEEIGEYWYVILGIGVPHGTRPFREVCLHPDQARKVAAALLSAADAADAAEAAGVRE